jgi:hypothetical protein
MRYFRAFLIGLIFLFPIVLAKAAQKTALLGVPIGATESQFLPEFEDSKFECAHKTEYAVECRQGKDIPTTGPGEHLYYHLTKRSQPPKVFSVQYNFDKIELKPTDLIGLINKTYAVRPLFYDPSAGCLATNPCHVFWALDDGIGLALNLDGPSSNGIYHYELKMAHIDTAAQEMGMENPFDAAAKEMNRLKNGLEDAKKGLDELDKLRPH